MKLKPRFFYMIKYKTFCFYSIGMWYVEILYGNILFKTAEVGKYNGESIRIKLAANIYYEFIPQTVFPIEQGYLLCDNTLFLFDVLPTLCYALDMAKSFRASAINRIKQFIVMNPKQAAHFKEAEKETLIKKADDLSAEELKALLQRIYAMEEN